MARVSSQVYPRCEAFEYTHVCYRRYTDASQLETDLSALQTRFGSLNERLCSSLQELYDARQKLCAFFTTQTLNNGKSSSQLSEVFNSSVKGGNEYARILRANNYYQTLHHISQLFSLYVDETVKAIQSCLKAKRVVSDYMYKKLEESIRRVARCLSSPPKMEATLHDGSEIWIVLEKVPEFGCLPAYDQQHKVTFKSSLNVQAMTCVCPYFVSTQILCSGCATVGSVKGSSSAQGLIPFLKDHWLVANHPLAFLAKQGVVSGGDGVDDHWQQEAADHNDFADPHGSCAVVAVSDIPQSASDRREMLTSVFNEVVSSTIKDTSLCRSLLEALVSHRAKCYSASSLLMPPASAITQAQENAGLGPQSEVKNLAAVAVYERRKKQRVGTAQNKDPTAYSLYKTAAFMKMVKCPCGKEVLNERRKMFVHRQSKEHQAWLKVHFGGMAQSQSQAALSDEADVVGEQIHEDESEGEAEGDEMESEGEAEGEAMPMPPLGKRNREESSITIFIEVTPQEHAAVDKMLKDPGNDGCKIVDVTLPGGFGYYLHGLNFKCLRPGIWLNSETIDVYFSMAINDVQFTEYLSWSKNEVLICDTSVMRYIAPRAGDKDGDVTAQRKSCLDFTLKWARRKAKDMGVQSILALKLWILPYNIGNVHWVLVVVDIDAKRVTLYESYSQGNHAVALAKVVDVLKLQASRDKLSEIPWQVEVIHTGHQDGNATECGVFMIAHAMHIILGNARSISSQCTLHNMLLFRKRIAADILQGYITLPK